MILQILKDLRFYLRAALYKTLCNKFESSYFFFKEHKIKKAIEIFSSYMQKRFDLSIKDLININEQLYSNKSVDIKLQKEDFSHKDWTKMTHMLGTIGLINLSYYICEKYVKPEYVRCLLTDAEGDTPKFFERFSKELETYSQKISPDLKKKLKDKTVAIVGPAETDDNSKEIDSCDYVVRIGYAGPDTIPNKTGKRTNASFYARHKIKYMISNNFTNYFKSLEFMIIKDNHSRTRSIKNRMRKLTQSDLKSRIINTGVETEKIFYSVKPEHWFKQTGPTSMHEALFTILLCQPTVIKLFNINLYLKFNYQKNYILGDNETAASWTTKSEESSRLCRAIAFSHEPSTQFEFLKALYNDGLFKADPTFSKIMSMNTSDYINQLDKNHGEPTRNSLLNKYL